MQRFHFLFSCMVVYQRDNLERLKRFNTLAVSQENIITAKDLGRAQQECQVRFHELFNKDEKAVVNDVYIEGISHLGYMTSDQFYDIPKGEDQPELPNLTGKVTNDEQPTHASAAVDPYRPGTILAADPSELSMFGTDDAGKFKDKDHGSTDQ